MSKISKLSQVQGPWQVDEGSNLLILDANGVELAEIVYRAEGAKIERISNLIAAAPELLLALYKTIILLKRCYGVDGWNSYYQESPEMRSVRYALAKANGEL